MTTRFCLVAYQCSPYKSSKQIDVQPYKASGRHTHVSISLRVTKVTAVDEKQASHSVDASADGRSLSRGSSAQSLAGLLKDGAKECEETQLQVNLQDLQIGSIYKGKVSAVESYGAFVDIGAYTDGFVHISRLGRAFVRSVEDVVKVGQDVCVQIVDLDLHANSISLLMRPDDGFNESVSLRPLTLSEREIINRAAARRANKLARRAENPLPRRGISLETRRHLKAYRRAVLAERQAIQLHLARSRARNPNDLDELDEIIKAKG